MTAKHVSPNYRHGPKRVSPGEVFQIGSSRLKWYDLAKADMPVEEGVRARAHRFFSMAATRPDWSLDADIGFVILHRCGDEFYFLVVCTWRGDNELWATVYFKPDASAADFELFPQRAHKGTFCVWEAGIVAHEMTAWSRFLKSARTTQDMDTYFGDKASGPVD